MSNDKQQLCLKLKYVACQNLAKNKIESFAWKTHENKTKNAKKSKTQKRKSMPIEKSQTKKKETNRFAPYVIAYMDRISHVMP